MTNAGRLVEDGGAPVVQAAASAPPARPSAVTATYPPYSEEFPQLVGMTVAQAKANLTEAWSIEANARVYVNGEQVKDLNAVRLGAGDRLEFAKAAAEKGRVWFRSSHFRTSCPALPRRAFFFPEVC